METHKKINNHLSPILQTTSFFFDQFKIFWYDFKTQKCLSNGLIILFLLSIGIIQLNIINWLPESISQYIPQNHLYSIDLAFNFLLLKEIVDMIFFLPNSISSAQKKQLEVLSLILIRFAFKDIPLLGEPIDWKESLSVIYQMLASGLSGLLIFIFVSFYTHLNNRPTLKDQVKRDRFIAEKKTIALGLLIIFLFIIFLDISTSISEKTFYYSIEIFFTVFIFADIAIVLISLRYSQLYYAVFRNAGFAFVAVLMRISLTAPPYYRETLAIVCTLFAYILALTYNRITGISHTQDIGFENSKTKSDHL